MIRLSRQPCHHRTRTITTQRKTKLITRTIILSLEMIKYVVWGMVLKRKSTNNSDDSNCKEAFPSTSPNTRPASRAASCPALGALFNRISDAEERAKECFPSTPHASPLIPPLMQEEPLTSSRKRRTDSSPKGMTSTQIRKMTSLMHFVSTHRTERINILQIAMTPFKVCYRSQMHWHLGPCVP